ncbi:zinc finger protein 839 isoform X2 [Pyxicephalus adspersus]|uniref:zinc finger protein 839 isoform X2 n=1 Tax=Pyxicephalus adspersus TaxID=30357 RepID=UPI003B5A3552
MAAPIGHDKMAAEAAGEFMQVVVGGDLEPGQQVVVLQGATGEEMRATDISSEFLQSIAHTDTIYYVQPDGSLVPGGTLAEVTGGEGTIGAPVMMDAALQLKNVADQVALRPGAPNQVTRINQKVKSICVQVPGLKSESVEDVNADDNLSNPVNLGTNNTAVVTTQVVQVKATPQPAQPLVVKAVQPPVQVMIQQNPVQVKEQDDNNEGEDSAEEHGCCVAHHQYGSCALGNTEKPQKKGQKRKKVAKIKTRSGRISRPPKHKAKDYKFLKVGESIQDSSVDSEEYSELSSEDEDGSKEKAPRDGQTYAVKNSLFQCQKCEKSYMGKGGVFRHYRLYPAHGQMDPSFVVEDKKSGDIGGTVEPKKPIPRPRKRLLEDPANPTVSSQHTLAKDGLEMVLVPSPRRGRPQMTGRRFGRPRKILRNGTVEQHAVSVKEMIQQCEEKDLKEQVAPSFTKLLSVYDFLVLKVKQDHMDTKPLFPHVYREFEKLHSMVKSLAEEYVINMDQNVEKPLEVTDTKVAESLGISKEMTVKAAPSSSSVTAQQKVVFVEHNDESSDDELMPPSKRLKMGDADSKTEEEGLVAEDCETSHSGGLGQHDNNQLTFDSAPDPGTDSTSEEVEQTTTSATGDLLVEVAESLQPHTQSIDHSQESLSYEQSSDPSQSQDHPINLSCQLAEEILSLQTHIVQNDTKEAADTEPASNLTCDLQTEATELEISCDHNLSSDDCSQVVDHTRTVLSTSSVPTTLAEAVCREATQVSFVEVGGTLIPTTNAFTTGNLSGVTPAFSLNHGQELLFIQSAEEAATEEAVVIFDNTGAAETHLDTVVALVKM